MKIRLLFFIYSDMKISNKDSQPFVQERKDFQGSNLCGKKLDNVYVVLSYGYYPIYVYKRGKWYGNSERFSNTTQKHKYSARPVGIDEIVWKKTEQLYQLIGMKIMPVSEYKVGYYLSCTKDFKTSFSQDQIYKITNVFRDNIYLIDNKGKEHGMPNYILKTYFSSKVLEPDPVAVLEKSSGDLILEDVIEQLQDLSDRYDNHFDFLDKYIELSYLGYTNNGGTLWKVYFYPEQKMKITYKSSSLNNEIKIENERFSAIKFDNEALDIIIAIDWWYEFHNTIPSEPDPEVILEYLDSFTDFVKFSDVHTKERKKHFKNLKSSLKRNLNILTEPSSIATH